MQRLISFLDGRTDPRPLAVARIMVAIIALVRIRSLADDLRDFATGNHVLFRYPIELPAPQSETSALVVIALWTSFGVFFLLGLWTRIAGAGLALTVLYVIWIDQQFYSNHLYLLAMLAFLLTIADSGARYSLDSLNVARVGDVPAWQATLLKFQLTSVYLFSAVAKINRDFLEGVVLEFSFDPVMLERITQFASVETLAVAAIVTELFLAFAFWSSRLRWIALPLAITFHVMIVALVIRSGPLELSLFGLMMGAVIVVFFSDLWERQALWRWSRRGAPVHARTGSMD